MKKLISILMIVLMTLTMSACNTSVSDGEKLDIESGSGSSFHSNIMIEYYLILQENPDLKPSEIIDKLANSPIIEFETEIATFNDDNLYGIDTESVNFKNFYFPDDYSEGVYLKAKDNDKTVTIYIFELTNWTRPKSFESHFTSMLDLNINPDYPIAHAYVNTIENKTIVICLSENAQYLSVKA